MKKLQLQPSTTHYVTLNELLAFQKNNLSQQYQEVKKMYKKYRTKRYNTFCYVIVFFHTSNQHQSTHNL